MLKLNTSTQFKKDYKTCIKRHYKMDLLQAVVDVLRVPDALPQKNRDHSLTGNYTGCHECHIQPDWILICPLCKGEMKPSTTALLLIIERQGCCLVPVV